MSLCVLHIIAAFNTADHQLQTLLFRLNRSFAVFWTTLYRFSKWALVPIGRIQLYELLCHTIFYPWPLILSNNHNYTQSAA